MSRWDAVAALALARPSLWPRDLRAVIKGGTFDPPPWNVVKGPVRARGGPAGVLLRDGKEVARWGDPDRADMVFSVTKSYVGLLAAVALDRGLLASLDEAASARVAHGAFASDRNRRITWRQLLQQTSEWTGTLWGVPDTVDRDRQLSPTEDPARFGRGTPPREPGAYWDYNDARVNALCLALTLLFERGLPDVLAEVLPPFADRAAWRWDGYGAESTVLMGGRAVEVVVGGGHWGGGMRSSVRQDAALGEVARTGGLWRGRRIVSREALSEVLTPCPLMPVYAGLWWLNAGGALVPGAPATGLLATGVGLNAVWTDPALGLTLALHWVEEAAFPAVVAAAVAARP